MAAGKRDMSRNGKKSTQTRVMSRPGNAGHQGDVEVGIMPIGCRHRPGFDGTAAIDQFLCLPGMP